MHQFNKSLPVGIKGEEQLDAYFSKHGYTINKHTSLQKIGCDRILQKDGKLLWAEYKTDTVTRHSLNVFIETISVDTANKQGWAYTSKASILVYFVPGLFNANKAMIADMQEIRKRLPTWKKTYRSVDVFNAGMFGGAYFTSGLLVPLSEFLLCCTEIIDLDGA